MFEANKSSNTRKNKIQLVFICDESGIYDAFTSFNNCPVGLAIQKPDNSLVEINPRLCQMLGFKKEELINRSWKELVHSRDYENLSELLDDICEGNTHSFTTELTLKCRDGSIVHTTLSTIGLRDERGSVHYFLSSLIENTGFYESKERINQEKTIKAPIQSSVVTGLIDISSIEAEIDKLNKNQVDLKQLLNDIKNPFRLEPVDPPNLINVPGLNKQKFMLNNPVTILIAEDDDIISFILKTMLSDPLIKIIIAKNGSEAVAKCKETSDIDLIFMDLNMPKMDGYVATKKIREFLPDLPIIAQTGNMIDIDQLSDYGFTDYIRKPFSKPDLISKINKYLSVLNLQEK